MAQTSDFAFLTLLCEFSSTCTRATLLLILSDSLGKTDDLEKTMGPKKPNKFPNLIGVILRLKWIQSKTQCVNFFKPESKKKLSDGLKSGIDSCRILLGYRAIACKAMSDKQIMQTKPNDKNLGEAHYLEIDKTFQTRLFLFP